MNRTTTKRVVEYDADDHRYESEDGSEHLDSYKSKMGKQTGARVQGPSHPNTSFDSSLRMSMTPTTRFLDQPILLDMTKDGQSTGSSSTLPGVPGNTRRGGRGGDSGGLHGQHTAIVKEELVNLRYLAPPLTSMAIAGLIGLVVGIVLNKNNPGFDGGYWIGVLGYLYLRVLECLALPLIFTSVSLCVAQLVVSSKSYSILVRMGSMFIAAAFLASATGMLVGYAMSPAFSRKSAPPVGLPTTLMTLQCPNEFYLSGNSLCIGKQIKDAAIFTVTNVTGITLRDTGEDVVDQEVDYAEQIVDFFSLMFQQNITEAFSTGSYLGIIVFAMFIGAGLIISQDYPDMTGQTNYLYHVLKQTDVVLEMILNWLIAWIPYGTVPAMIYTTMTGTITKDIFEKAMYLPIALLVALVVNFLFVVCVAYYMFVRKNPFQFLWYLLPALIYMVASQRYMATIPIMMRSIESSKQVSRTLAQFTVSLGTALSMCGHACFFSISCVFMAYTSGLEHKLTAGRVILLIIVSALSSFATPQTPGASLTYVATIWRTVFGIAPPDSFAFVVGMEWLTVRLRRVHNITVVAFIARVIAEQLDETAEDEDDRAMAENERDSREHEFGAPL